MGIFGEFEIDEDYMIKSKDVIGLFVAVKEEPKAEEPAPAPVEEAPAEEDEVRPRRRRRRRGRLPSKYPAVFRIKKSWLTFRHDLSGLTGYKFSTFQKSSKTFEFVTLLHVQMHYFQMNNFRKTITC